MDGDGIPEFAHSDRARKPIRRRPRTVKLTKRDGYWCATGTLIAGGRSTRIRKSLGLSVATTPFRQAEIALAEYLDDEKARITGATGRGDTVAVAALGYLNAPRARPLGASTIRIVKKIKDRFDGRRLNAIGAEEWRSWVDELISTSPNAITALPLCLNSSAIARRATRTAARDDARKNCART